MKTAPSVDDSSANSTNAAVTFTVTDAKLLTGDSYRVDYTATGVNLRNLTTDAVTTLGASREAPKVVTASVVRLRKLTPVAV